MCVPLTAISGGLTHRQREASARMARLPMDSVTLDRQLLTEERGKLSTRRLDLVLTGIDLVLGR